MRHPEGTATARRRLAALAWTAFLAACLAGLHATGEPLAPPPLTEPGALGSWAEGREPVEAAVALVRLATLAMAWYLLAATAAGVIARLSGALTLVRWADALSVPVVRRIASGAVGLSLAAAATAAPAPAVATPLPRPAAEGAAGARSGASPPPTMRLLPSTAVDAAAAGPSTTATTAATAPRSPGPAPAADAATAPPEPAAPHTWTVRPGDHLWAVAERTLADAWGRPPSDAEVTPYWRTVVEANRARLRDPANPDLVFPDQTIALPSPPPPH